MKFSIMRIEYNNFKNINNSIDLQNIIKLRQCYDKTNFLLVLNKFFYRYLINFILQYCVIFLVK